MSLFKRQRLSDQQIVERTRKSLRTSRRVAWLYLALGVLVSAGFIYFLCLGLDWVASADKVFSEETESYKFGLLTGYSLGFVATLLLAKAAFYFYEFIDLLVGNRGDKLLVACYDQLHPFDSKAPAPSSASMT